ncbi:hypothetical protein E4U15_005835 [Claviceps sp. LM218 group G6]|nr:hypothetical protein E4U15_005835 [Claviceps sp. LM218 group G6]
MATEGLIDIVCEFFSALELWSGDWSLRHHDSLDVTDDFDDAACFDVGDVYRLEYRKPSSPGVATGISLVSDDMHFGWVRERSRVEVEDFLIAGKTVFGRIRWFGKRWRKYDGRLRCEREWQEGVAFYWVENDDDGNK